MTATTMYSNSVTQMPLYTASTQNQMTTWVTLVVTQAGLLQQWAGTTSSTLHDGPYVVADPTMQAVWEAACVRTYTPPLLPIYQRTGVAPAGRLFIPGPENGLPTVAILRRRRRDTLYAGRRALRRSIDLYARIRGAAEIGAFLRGEQITISGSVFDYRVQKNQSILKHTIDPRGGHVPYGLEIALKDTPGAINIKKSPSLAQGCVFFENTPVIDQILALTFNVQAPDDERELVRRANWAYRSTEARATVLRAFPPLI